MKQATPSAAATGGSTPARPSLRRTLVKALVWQSVAVLGLTLGVMVAGAGIQQRLVLALGLILVMVLASSVAWYLAKTILQPLDRFVAASEGLARGATSTEQAIQGVAEWSELAPALQRLSRVLCERRVGQEKLALTTDPLNESPAPFGSEPTGLRLELQDAERTFATLLSNLPWPFLVTDAQGRITRHNAAAAKLLGREQSEWAGQPIESVLSAWITHDLAAALEEHVQNGRVWHGGCTVKAKEGRELSLDITVMPVRDERRGLLASLYLAEDVTELKQLQSLVIDMERTSTRGRMAGEIAHEINNFLTILGGNLDIIPMLLAAGNQDKVIAKFAAMRQVLEKIARFSDALMSHRDHDAEPSPCDLNKLIERMVAFLKPQNRYDGIEFSLQCDPDLPRPSVKVGQVQQVLVNLLNNAADAVREASGQQRRIEIRTRRIPERGQVAVSVKDNGRGLTSVAAARMFKERYSDKKAGHGLGLLNCFKIAQAHRGSLTVESLEGCGATFTLTLPLAADTSGVPSPPSRAAVSA